MITKSPSGALSPYYYKGGYFHGIHYGSYFENVEALFNMMDQEEQFILKCHEQKRILIDLYQTSIEQNVIERLIQHLEKISPRIFKLAIATDKINLKKIHKAIKGDKTCQSIYCYFSTDMEEAKTWLVSDYC